MSYNGLEIDMLSLGKADSILVTKWNNGTSTRVLIDGGNRGSSEDVRGFLSDHNISWIDHVVCSHPHDDHSGGLIDLVNDTSLDFGRMWMHLPGEHTDVSSLASALSSRSRLKTSEIVAKSLTTASELVSSCRTRGLAIEEPFEGDFIGFLRVCGPSVEYYEEQVQQFSEPGELSAIELSQEAVRKSASTGLLESPTTAPQNNTSTILMTTNEDNDVYLFTADSGVEALERAVEIYALDNIDWMQLPHHGSRHNITQGLISNFSPSVAYVSAPGDNDSHPHDAVVEAFKNEGTEVYSTHYPRPSSIHHYSGSVPTRYGQVAATPLWD